MRSFPPKKIKNFGKRSYFSCFFNSFFQIKKRRKWQVASKEKAGRDAKHVFFFYFRLFDGRGGGGGINVLYNIIIIITSGGVVLRESRPMGESSPGELSLILAPCTIWWAGDKCPVLSLLLLLPPGPDHYYYYYYLRGSRPMGESSGGSRPRGSCPDTPAELSWSRVTGPLYYLIGGGGGDKCPVLSLLLPPGESSCGGVFLPMLRTLPTIAQRSQFSCLRCQR